MAKPANDAKSGPAKRSAWVYRAPATPPLADLFKDGDRRKTAFRYHVSGNLKNLLDLTVHFGLKAVPASICSAAGARLGTFVIPRWHRSSVKKTQKNLRRLLPDATEEERDQVLKRSWQNQGRIMTEFSIIRRLWRRATWHDLHHFTDAYKKGPVIVVCMHLGNWEIFAPKLVELGLSPFANYTPPAGRARVDRPARAVKARIRIAATRQGRHTASTEHPEKGGAISVFCDEGFAGKIRGPFFGRPPHLEGNLAVVARLARLTGATICPCYAVRSDGTSFDGFALPPVILPPENKPGERLIDDVLLLNAVIEPVIRAHLDQWYFLDNAL
ncbi:hypothetical protein LP421_21605 [Rhizobium sp. RCAM05350]|nr:hypothetical protein LP421_21605 [Rhizobium sp. RCAM05350]